MGRKISGLYSKDSKGHGIVIYGEGLKNIDHDIEDLTSIGSGGDGITLGKSPEPPLPSDTNPAASKNRFLVFMKSFWGILIGFSTIGAFVLGIIAIFR